MLLRVRAERFRVNGGGVTQNECEPSGSVGCGRRRRRKKRVLGAATRKTRERTTRDGHDSAIIKSARWRGRPRRPRDNDFINAAGMGKKMKKQKTQNKSNTP